MDLKLMRMMLFILCTLFDCMIALNHTSAEAECKEKGGLASYRQFAGDEGNGVNKGYDLREGESAWISGYVKFSKFVAYYGCFSESRGKFEYELEENNIYNCLLNCTQKVNITFIGIRNKFCYCVENLTHFSSKPDSDCNQELVNSNLELNINAFTIKTNISMYRIIDERHLYKPVTEAQCVKTWSDEGAIRYGTESCDYKAESFICTKSAHTSQLSNKCVTIVTPFFCIVSNSSTWLSSFKDCLKYTGKLTDFVYEEVYPYSRGNTFYWTGIFRTFKIETKSGVSSKSVCLSVKKVNSKIVLDPAACSAEKAYICENVFSKKTESSSTQKIVVTKTNSAKVSRFVATSIFEYTTLTFAKKFLSSKPTIQTATENNEFNLNVVYIAVGVVFTVALTLIITCIILRKRKLTKATMSPKPCNSKVQGNNITDNSVRGSIPDDVSLKQQLAQSVEDEVTYAKPDTAKKHSPLSDSEYDSIRVNVPGERKENTAKAKTNEDHVYGFRSAHPIDSDIEVYDHLEAARKTNILKPTDGIYNTLAEDSDTYNVLGHENKKESSKSGVNQTQIKETCPTYDKLK